MVTNPAKLLQSPQLSNDYIAQLPEGKREAYQRAQTKVMELAQGSPIYPLSYYMDHVHDAIHPEKISQHRKQIMVSRFKEAKLQGMNNHSFSSSGDLIYLYLQMQKTLMTVEEEQYVEEIQLSLLKAMSDDLPTAITPLTFIPLLESLSSPAVCDLAVEMLKKKLPNYLSSYPASAFFNNSNPQWFKRAEKILSLVGNNTESSQLILHNLRKTLSGFIEKPQDLGHAHAFIEQHYPEEKRNKIWNDVKNARFNSLVSANFISRPGLTHYYRRGNVSRSPLKFIQSRADYMELLKYDYSSEQQQVFLNHAIALKIIPPVTQDDVHDNHCSGETIHLNELIREYIADKERQINQQAPQLKGYTQCRQFFGFVNPKTQLNAAHWLLNVVNGKIEVSQDNYNHYQTALSQDGLEVIVQESQVFKQAVDELLISNSARKSSV